MRPSLSVRDVTCECRSHYFDNYVIWCDGRVICRLPCNFVDCGILGGRWHLFFWWEQLAEVKSAVLYHNKWLMSQRVFIWRDQRLYLTSIIPVLLDFDNEVFLTVGREMSCFKKDYLNLFVTKCIRLFRTCWQDGFDGFDNSFREVY